MEIMKILVPVCLLLVSSCLAMENATTKLEQQLNVQKREKQYLIEDDPNEGAEQKRDERQSTPVIHNRNLDPKGNSRIINIRIQPTSNILTAPKQAIKPGPQRIPTKIPVILKTANVVPGPAHAVRMKMLENRINDSICTNKQNNLYPNNAPSTPTMSNSIPYFTIEDKTTRKSESRSSPNNINDEKPDLSNNETLNRDAKEKASNDGKDPLNKDGNASLNEAKDDQVTLNSDRKTVVPKPIHFFVDEPEPLPPSFRRKQKYENTAFQSKEVPPNKVKEMPISKKGSKKPKKDEIGRNDDDNDPDIVKISNGTHLISIKKIPDHDRYNTERLDLRNGEEDTAPTEERIINHPPPETKPEKPVYDEPEKHSFSITEKINTGKQQNVGLTGLPFRNNQNNEGKGQNNCITITKHDYEEIEEKTPITPSITFQPTISPTVINEGNQESWNYLQNPYYNTYYQNIYDQYRKNYGLAQTIPNLYAHETDQRSNGGQINPCMYSQGAIVEPYVPEITTPYYPNSIRTDTDAPQYPYNPYVYESQPEIDNTAWPRQEARPENTLDRIRKTWKDVEIKIRQQGNDTEVLLPDIDIRRDIDRNFDGSKVENGISKVANPYSASSLPININGALVYPYLNPGYRYMR